MDQRDFKRPRIADSSASTNMGSAPPSPSPSVSLSASSSSDSSEYCSSASSLMIGDFSIDIGSSQAPLLLPLVFAGSSQAPLPLVFPGHSQAPQPHPTPDLVPFDIKQKGVAIDIAQDDGFHHMWFCTFCGSSQLKRLPQCQHCLCDVCVHPFITEMVKNNSGGFKCPVKSCSSFWTLEQCRDYLPDEVYDRCIQAAREARILADPRYIYCPFPKCGAQMVDDLRGYLIRACTSCWGLFCTRCKVDWHVGMSCDYYQARAQAAAQALLDYDGSQHQALLAWVLDM